MRSSARYVSVSNDSIPVSGSGLPLTMSMSMSLAVLGYDELELLQDLSAADVDEIVQAVGMRAGHSKCCSSTTPLPSVHPLSHCWYT